MPSPPDSFAPPASPSPRSPAGAASRAPGSAAGSYRRNTAMRPVQLQIIMCVVRHRRLGVFVMTLLQAISRYRSEHLVLSASRRGDRRLRSLQRHTAAQGGGSVRHRHVPAASKGWRSRDGDRGRARLFWRSRRAVDSYTVFYQEVAPAGARPVVCARRDHQAALTPSSGCRRRQRYRMPGRRGNGAGRAGPA